MHNTAEEKKISNINLYSGKTISENLSYLLNEYKITLHHLHKNTKVPLTTLNRIKNDPNANPTLSSLLPIAEFFSLTLNQLAGLEPLPTERPVGVYTEKREYWTYIPIITWSEAINWPSIKPSGIDKKNTISTDIELSKDAFALLLTEDDWQGFLKGAFLIFDPNKTPNHKDYVLVYKSDANQTTLYQFLKNNDEIYLKHPCPDFKTNILDDTYTIKGTLLQVRMDIGSEDKKTD